MVPIRTFRATDMIVCFCVCLYLQVFVKFLFHLVEVTACHINVTAICAEERSPSQEIFVFKLFGCTLTCLAHLLKSGQFITLNSFIVLRAFERSLASTLDSSLFNGCLLSFLCERHRREFRVMMPIFY